MSEHEAHKQVMTVLLNLADIFGKALLSVPLPLRACVLFVGHVCGTHEYPLAPAGDGHVPVNIYSNGNYNCNNDDASFGLIMPDEHVTSGGRLAPTTIATEDMTVSATTEQNGDGHLPSEGTEAYCGDVAANTVDVTAT